jgi:hypothetical protein
MMRQILINAYLDYINNYLGVATYADHNGMTVDHATKFLDLAYEVFNSTHPDA